ncbi:uncharacterized protein BX664DRAFT_381400 [Halteromyces radiatus]|uniref:uncharacterized protein n=1 Tax=Halteromyces radiatus TaxID=101107 RepID=UPI0022202E91|nr:uncharacterized protein BX664DRAFT_381400 [Halteromyces radiatus]KAI8098724.1 hypothetical protein BX664DRAFT_381400 [Halteromyces radiatus]
MMSFDSVNSQMTSQFSRLHLQETGLTPEKKLTRLEIDNAYLTQQNEHLQRELSFARYTINALKTITQQKDTTLQDTRMELERAYLRIKMLGISMMRQQQDLIYHQQQQQQQQAGPGDTMIEEEKPMLIMDADSSDDQQELSDEEETTQRRPLSSIMTKLPLRQHPAMVYENQSHQSLSSPPTSPLNL